MLAHPMNCHCVLQTGGSYESQSESDSEDGECRPAVRLLSHSEEHDPEEAVESL